MSFKVGVTTGIHSAARSEELATAIKKLGYALTRGTSAVEIAQDVPHEVNETDGRELRAIAKGQHLDILMHGSLTIPMGIPERGDWRDAHDHIMKSIKSAVFSGAKYINFHASLQVWLELLTYTSRKLTMAFCDHKGRFILHILKENKKLREWFVERRGDYYRGDVLTNEEMQKEASRASAEWGELYIQRTENEAFEKIKKEKGENGKLSPKEIERIREKIREDASTKHAEAQKRYIQNAMRRKLEKGERWDTEELRAAVGILDGYHILGHYMFFEKDPLWIEMVKMYDHVLKKYNIDYNDDYWLDEAWRKAEEDNDREFKEFFYGVIAAKYLQGHLQRAFEWMYDEKKGLLSELKKIKDKKESEELIKNMKDLIIAIETPDARDPSHAGLHLLWSNRQIYTAIKVIRKTLKHGKNVLMLADFEHTATQGVDPIGEIDELKKIAPDFGKQMIAVHSNAPNPTHAHEPLELGDIRIYKLLWFLKETGFGSERKVFIMYERGGGEDPFKHSVDFLKLCVKYLEQDIKPEDLPLGFYGIEEKTAGGKERQRQIIMHHRFEPLKDLLEMPEEEWGMLSGEARKKGKAEQWKKAEFR